MAYQYPLNGGRINASVSGNSTSAGAGYQLVSTGTLVLAGGNNVTLNQDANSISISGLNYANSNGVTFGINAGTLTASVNAAQSVQTIGGYASGNTTGQSSSTTFDARSMSISAMGGASAGFSGGMLQVSAPAMSSLSQTGIISLSQNGNTISIGAPAFSAGMSALGNTAGTSGTVSNQIIFAGGNNVTLSQSTGAGGNTITISGANIPAQTVQTQSRFNMTLTGNTAGVMAQVSSGVLSLAGGNNIVLSQAGNAITISGSAQTAQTQSNIQGIIASGSTNQTGNISFANANGVTFGLSNNTVTASFSGGGGGGGGIALANSQTTYTSGTANLIGSGAISINSTTGQSYIISAPVVSSLSETGIVSISRNGNTISIGASQSIQTQGLQTINLGGNTAGAMASISSGALSLYGGNNITLSQNANSVTISGGAGGGGGGGGVALSAAGGSISSGTASIAAGGAMTASINGQTLNLSAPATSSLSATGAISIATNGGTISIGAPQKIGSYFDNMFQQANNQTSALAFTAVSGMSQRLLLQPLAPGNELFPFNLTAGTMRINLSNNITNSSGSSHGFSTTLYIGLYNRINSTQLSLINSGSVSYGISANLSNTVSVNGPRWVTLDATQFSAGLTFAEGTRYFFGLQVRTSGTNFNNMSMAGMHLGVLVNRSGQMASASTSNSTGFAWHPFMGVWNSVLNSSVTALPASIANSSINKVSAYANFIPQIILDGGLGQME